MSTGINTIFVVDDDDAVRDSLALMIRQEGFNVETFADAEAFLQVAKPELRGCAIVDMRMPGMDGMQLQQELKQRGILLPIIFLTGHGNIPMSVRGIKAGAIDFLTKPVARNQLMDSIVSAVRVGEELHTHQAISLEAKKRLKDLTEREREVMLLAIEGNPNKQIARKLNISHRTVEIHKSHIMQKTGSSNLLELTRLVQDANLAWERDSSTISMA